MNEHIKNLQSTVTEQANQISIMNQTILMSESEKKRVLDDCTALRLELVDISASKNKEIEQMHQLWDMGRIQMEKLNKELLELKKVSKRKLMGYTWWKRFYSLWRR